MGKIGTNIWVWDLEEGSKVPVVIIQLPFSLKMILSSKVRVILIIFWTFWFEFFKFYNIFFEFFKFYTLLFSRGFLYIYLRVTCLCNFLFHLSNHSPCIEAPGLEKVSPYRGPWRSSKFSWLPIEACRRARNSSKSQDLGKELESR